MAHTLILVFLQKKETDYPCLLPQILMLWYLSGSLSNTGPAGNSNSQTKAFAFYSVSIRLFYLICQVPFLSELLYVHNAQTATLVTGNGVNG